MRRSFRTHRPPKLPSANETFCRILAITMLALFVAMCLGRLLVPQNVLFGELAPVVLELLVVVVRYYFTGRERT